MDKLRQGCLPGEALPSFSILKSKKKKHLFENTVVKTTPTRYLKADMIPFDITLNSGATVSPKKANIQIPETNFNMIDTLQSMINRRTNLRALIIDYDESVSNVSLQSGSVATKRELTIADNTGFKIQATLWSETANTFRPQLGRAVVIENALIKSYLQNVTASLDKIAYCSDPIAKSLNCGMNVMETLKLSSCVLPLNAT